MTNRIADSDFVFEPPDGTGIAREELEQMNSKSYETVFVHHHAGRNLDRAVERGQLRTCVHAAGSKPVGRCRVPAPREFRVHGLEKRPSIAPSVGCSGDIARRAEKHRTQARVRGTDRFADPDRASRGEVHAQTGKIHPTPWKNCRGVAHSGGSGISGRRISRSGSNGIFDGHAGSGTSMKRTTKTKGQI